MKALQFAEYGNPEVLNVVEVEEPHAGPGQVRVRVRAVGVNPVDWKARSGMFTGPLPRTTGVEGAGVVDELGAGVTAAAVGDAVFGSAIGGAAAEWTLMEHFARIPEGMSFVDAAALTTAVETSVRAFELLGLTAGQTLLVNGAAGGVGVAAVQLAVARGATVIGTASPGNHEFLRSLGVVPTTYGHGLPDRVRALAPQGVDLAFDTAGRGALPDLVAITGSPDRVVTIADYGAAEHGVRFTGGGEGRAWHALEEAVDLVRAGRLTLPVARTFPLDQGAAAHRLSEDGHVRGKLVLVVE